MILFRADGNGDIGMGHIMRCLAIAAAARESNHECEFIIADKAPLKTITENGYKCHVLNTDYADMQHELPQLISLIDIIQPALLFIDSYYTRYNYLGELTKHVKTAFIDDEADYPYPVNWLINYNIYSCDLNYNSLYNGSAKPNLLLGTSYVPLRQQFIATTPIEIRVPVKNIFVSTGGTDNAQIALQLARRVNCIQTGVVYHIVAGKFNRNYTELVNLKKHCNSIELYSNISDMNSLMQECDIAVSAAGSTLYELCACGIPTIAFAVAQNQILGINAFASREIIINAGDARYESNIINSILNHVQALMNNNDQRCAMSMKGKHLVDGNGAKRIINTIFGGK